jgi:ABC-type sulfate transport system permease subunit|tara:strand:- start:278 stop:472 length:195 start_codon:yes stop_codon:yes gene_type:complete
MTFVLKTIFQYGALVFAFGFIAPLTMQIITRAGIDLPFGLSPLMAGLILAALWGGIAQYRGRWI